MPSVYDNLLSDPYGFDFFQAVRLLRKRRSLLESRSEPVPNEVARFHAHLSLTFPPSSIQALTADPDPEKPHQMTVAFLGLFGPSGVLPHQYTQRIIEREYRHSRDSVRDALSDADRALYDRERRALRDWLDLFNHRLIDKFYRSWEKYHFYLAYERHEPAREQPDSFTQAIYSLMGLGTPWHRNRLRVTVPTARESRSVATKAHDIGLFRFAGLLAQRTRNAWGLQAFLSDYFRLNVVVQQFQGQWLSLDAASQSQLGKANCRLGTDVVAGDRVWDIQGKLRLRLGPFDYEQFLAYLPSREPVPTQKSFFLFAQMTRFYAGPDFDFDVQLVLKASAVPSCQLNDDPATGPRLGWNCWLLSEPAHNDAPDALFEGTALTHVGKN